MGDVGVGIAIWLTIMGAAAGTAIGLCWGEMKKAKLLENMLTHGTPNDAPAGHTIKPDTAESRIDVSAKIVEEQYEQATINQGVEHLEALCVSEGREVPSKKELEKEVRDMLGRSGTPEAGVNA